MKPESISHLNAADTSSTSSREAVELNIFKISEFVYIKKYFYFIDFTLFLTLNFLDFPTSVFQLFSAFYVGNVAETRFAFSTFCNILARFTTLISWFLKK